LKERTTKTEMSRVKNFYREDNMDTKSMNVYAMNKTSPTPN